MKYPKPHSLTGTRGHSLAIVTCSLFAASAAFATNYYWDSNGDGTAGFGSGGTWSSAGTGNLWSTSPTGDGVGGAAVADYATTTSDDLFFGTESIGIGGTITINGTVNANSIFNEGVGFDGTNPTINFSDEGTYIRARNNGSFPAGTTFTGLATSLRWQPQRNLNVSNVSHSAGSVILSTSPTSTFSYPGRTVMSSSANLGAVGTPLVFDDGTLRLNSGFPYTSLSALNADHPVSFIADKDAGFEVLNGPMFTVDLPIDLGTGTFWPESSSSNTVKLTQANTWGQINLTSAVVEVSEAAQLGPVTATVQFGSGTEDLAGGALRIVGNTFASFDPARPFATTPGKSVGFDIVEAAHTFTLDRVLDNTTVTIDDEEALGTLTKDGAGTLVLTENNLYEGATSVNAGTLALVGGSQASPITVSSGASLGFEIGSETTSTSSVDLTSGNVTVLNPGNVDNASDYRLMTATGGFTFTDISTQLGTSITDYELELRNGDSELWLVYTGTGGGGINYATWAGGFTSFNDITDNVDFDQGGLESGIEYVVGGDPTDGSDDGNLAPTFNVDGTELTFTFQRDQASIHPDTTVTIEVGTDLPDFPDIYTVGTDTASSSAGVTVDKDTPLGFDTVTLTLTMAPDDKKFARLHVATEAPLLVP